MTDSVYRKVLYLSPPMPVSMSDDWYGVAPLSHFWIQRRFEVLNKLAGGILRDARALADVGCGHGMMQRLVEDAYHKPITGFDLNALPLEQSISRISDVCCYNMLQKNAEYKSAFDAIIVFDVFEHLEDDSEFLDAVRFHLAPGGKLLVNVPAFNGLWSRYDQVCGHKRRYNIGSLRDLAGSRGMSISRWTYWGMPLTPLLLLRKLWLRLQPEDRVIQSGFQVPGELVNSFILAMSRLELIPQHAVGTSVMAILENAE